SFTHPSPTQIYTLSLHDALPISPIYSAEAFPNTLPALPKAKVSNLWWPTFFISLDERKEICGGTLPQEKLGISGSIPLLTSPLRSEEHTSELQSRSDLVCRLLLE